MKRTTGRVLLLGVAASLQLMACQLLVGIDDDETGLPGQNDAQTSVDANGNDAADSGDIVVAPSCPLEQQFVPRTPADTCVEATLPERPTGVPAVAGEDSNRITFVLRKMFFEPQDGSVIGYDLDGKCTGLPGEGVPDRCPAPVSPQNENDQPGGVDNAILNVMRRAIAPLPPNSVAARAEKDAEEGIRSLMIELYGYNGLADDEDVAVSISTAPGFVHQNTGCDYDFQNPEDRPAWDGQDAWCMGAITLGNQRMEGTMTGGYVRDGVIVLPVHGTSVPFLLGLDVPLMRGALVGRFTESPDGSRRARATVIGFARVDEFFAAARRLEVGEFNNQPLYVCKRPGLENDLRQALNAGADARTCPTSPSCDGVSLAVGFDLVEVQRGPVLIPPERPDPCAEEAEGGVDAGGDVDDASADAEVDAGPVMP